MRVEFGTGFLVIALVTGARAGIAIAQEQPLERQWTAYTRHTDDDIGWHSTSVAVDSQCRPHFAWIIHDPDYALYYGVNHPDGDCYISGMLVPRNDFPLSVGMGSPDICVDRQDNIYVVWIHNFLDLSSGRTYSRIYLKRKTQDGWMGHELRKRPA